MTGGNPAWRQAVENFADKNITATNKISPTVKVEQVISSSQHTCRWKDKQDKKKTTLCLKKWLQAVNYSHMEATSSKHYLELPKTMTNKVGLQNN